MNPPGAIKFEFSSMVITEHRILYWTLLVEAKDYVCAVLQEGGPAAMKNGYRAARWVGTALLPSAVSCDLMLSKLSIVPSL